MTGAILAGGRSRRMQGRDKTGLRRDGERVLARTARLLAAACGACILVAREDQAPALEALGLGDVYADLYPGRGPMGGLYTALEETEDDILLAACDLPYLEDALLARLCAAFRAQTGFALLPRSPVQNDPPLWRVEPLCAVWSKHCRRPAYLALEAQELSMTEFAAQLPARYIDLSAPEAQQLKNINTVQEMQETGGDLQV